MSREMQEGRLGLKVQVLMTVVCCEETVIVRQSQKKSHHMIKCDPTKSIYSKRELCEGGSG